MKSVILDVINRMNQFKISLGIVALLGMFALSSCEKNEVIVSDNTAPPDSTISTLVIENYANKCYISLLGREPSETEEQAAVSILSNGNLSVESRNQVLSDILANPEYNNKLIEYNSIKLLNAYDTTEVLSQIYVYTLLLQDPQYAPFYDLINYEIDRYNLLLDTPQDLANGSIGVVDMHRRLVDNGIYDGINMGSFNFVLSLFNHFLFRDPTAAEHDAGIIMVDGFVGVLMLETGSSKEDLLDIFFGSDDYYEGQVRELFSRYLFREPNSEEQNYYSVQYRTSGDYKQLQRDILSLDEFVGL